MWPKLIFAGVGLYVLLAAGWILSAGVVQESGGVELLPNTTDWLGRFRPQANHTNDYEMDRGAQLRGEHFTGIVRIPSQDRMAAESMGEISDHDFEHLKSSDLMISRTRRRLFGAAEALVRDGTVPPAVDNPDVCNGARGGDYLADEKLGFVETYREQIAKIDPSPVLAK
jgi:hypothetical protein